MESKHKYGLLGAGAVRTSLIGRLHSRARDIGPVCSTSYRVASRIANAVGAGFAVRTAEELGAAPCVLVHAPAEYMARLESLLRGASIDWRGKALVFCDCSPAQETIQEFLGRGASAAVTMEFGARLIAEADEGPALRAVRSLARDLGLRPTQIAKDAGHVFAAAVLLGTAALTPLIDRAAELLRQAGIREAEAARLAASLFEQTARDYAHSGQQSWAWYARHPEPQRLKAELANEPLLRTLLLYALNRFGKHEELRTQLAQE